MADAPSSETTPAAVDPQLGGADARSSSSVTPAGRAHAIAATRGPAQRAIANAAGSLLPATTSAMQPTSRTPLDRQ